MYNSDNIISTGMAQWQPIILKTRLIYQTLIIH